jgi:hypothetical protein
VGETAGVATPLDDGSWEVRGRRLTFPVRISSARAACATYLVPTARARRLVAGTGLEPVSLLGRTPLFLALVDYRVNDLGDYDEVGVALLVRHRGQVGPYVHQLPVTQGFTMEAGRALWGLPKWRARMELRVEGRDATCHLADDGGRHVLTAALRTPPLRLPVTVRGALAALAPRGDGVLVSPVRARLRGLRVGPGGARTVLGADHPVADELRALRLPHRPLLTAIVDDVAFDMGPARAVPR